MPKVRASSGMIGTTRWPKAGSRARFRTRRVKAIVVDADWPPEPDRTSLNAVSAGRVSVRRVRSVRRGSEPASALRRSTMYWYSTESSGGR